MCKKKLFRFHANLINFRIGKKKCREMFPNFHPETNFSSILIHSTHSLNFYTNQKSLFAKNWKLFTYERGLFEP